MLHFTHEKTRDVIKDIVENCRSHWKEMEGYRHGQGYNPDIERYIDYEDRGFFFLFTVRDNGKLVGNCGMYIMPSMHTQQLTATEDTWFLLPEYRKGWTAVRFYKFVEKEMKKHDVVEITMSSRSTSNTGIIMERLGYKKIATQYSKQV